MKKYLPFQLIMMIFFCNTLYVYSMEKESIQNNVCYLAMLPADVWNYIAQFLPWEEQEKFIARMHGEKDEEFPKEYYAYFGCENGLGIEHVIGTFSPDKKKIALLEKNHEACLDTQICTMCRAPTLVIADLEEKQQDDRILFVGTVDTRYYRTIGLSSSANMYAVIRKERKNEAMVTMASHRDYKDILVVYNRTKKQECTFDIPDDFYVSCLMFNKQGTCVIAYAHDFSCKPMQKNYRLFDLKNVDKKENDADEKAVVENKDAKNRLLDYFRHYRICKEIKEIEK